MLNGPLSKIFEKVKILIISLEKKNEELMHN